MHVLITHKGYRVDLANPDPETICLADIAHSLAALVRFNGHLRNNSIEMYSVAEHCIKVSEKVAELALAGGADVKTQNKLILNAILHDAHEAYVGEITRPVANLLDFKAPVQRLKARVQNAIHKHLVHEYDIPGAFYLERHQDELIAKADTWAAAYEARHLHSKEFVESVSEWQGILTEEEWRIPQFNFYGSEMSESCFISRLKQQLEIYIQDSRK